jgi:hypothetical protein
MKISSQDIAKQSYWGSPEAIKLFNPKEDDDTVKVTLERRVQLLCEANHYAESYRHIVEGRDPDDLCSKSDLKALQQRSMLLYRAYRIALKHMERPDYWTWTKCCEQACNTLNPIGISQATHHRRVQIWKTIFRISDNFPHPNPYAQIGRQPEPQLFAVYPELKTKVELFCKNNLVTLTIESLYDHVHSTLIPEIHAQFIEDLPQGAPNECFGLEHFFHCFNLKNLSLTTVGRWMHYLGYTYDRAKKSFYIDCHERPDVVEERKNFCKISSGTGTKVPKMGSAT